jgi:hypothetical protein
MSEDNTKFVESEFREYARGNLPNQKHRDVYKWAGLVRDRQIANHLAFCETVYEPAVGMPDEFVETQYARDFILKYGTEVATNALAHQNLTQLSYYAGIVGYGADASAFPLLTTIKKLVKPDDQNHMLNLVFTAPPPPEGPTGVGKTNGAYTFIEGIRLLVPDIQIATNNASDPFESIHSWGEFKQWVKNTPGRKLYYMDEAAQVLQYKDQSDGLAVSKMIKLGRHYQCDLMFTAHTGIDVPKDLRRMVLFAKKLSQKKIQIGAGLVEDKAGYMNIKNVLYEIDKIPPTTIPYKSIGDTGSFTFDESHIDDSGSETTDNGGIDTTRYEAVIDYLSGDEGLRPVSERYEVSHEELRQWVKEFTGDN